MPLLADTLPHVTDTVPQVTGIVPLLTDTFSTERAIIEPVFVPDTIAVDDDVKNAWKRKIFRHGWSINDTSIVYPPVLDFGFKT